MNPKTHSITRRTLLRGFGAAITLPFLDIMGGCTLAAESGAKEPRRLACFYIPGAINRHTWFPKDTGRDYTLADAHKPLAKFRDEFTVLSNLSHVTGRISGHVHPYNWLTGHNINIVPGTITNTVSMDQVAAKHLGPTWVPSLALSFADGVGTATLSRNAMGVDVPATANYRSVFERLFPPADKAQLKEAGARIALDKSVLDTATGSVKDFQKQLGADDRRRLDQYLESIREVEKRLDDSREILERGRPKFDEEAVKTVPQGKNSMREHIELMMDLIALAFQTDMTRVVTHSLGGEGGPNYDEYKDWAQKNGAPVRGAHDVHHKGGGEATSPDAKVLGARDEMLVACLARLVEKLKGVNGEGDRRHAPRPHGAAVRWCSDLEPLEQELPDAARGRPQARVQARPAPEVGVGQEADVRPVPDDPPAARLPGEVVQGEHWPDHGPAPVRERPAVGGSGMSSLRAEELRFVGSVVPSRLWMQT